MSRGCDAFGLLRLASIMSIVGAGLLTSACVVKIKEAGFNPTDYVSWSRVTARAGRAGAKESGRLMARSRALIIPDDDPIHGQISASFAATAQARRRLILRAERPFGFEEGAALVETRGRMSGKAPALVAIGVDDPVALTYPDGRILISRRLVDGLWPDDPDMAAWALKVVAAHELAHHQDGHAVFNWAAINGQRHSARKRLLSRLSRLTSIIPFAYLRYEYSPGAGFKSIRAHQGIFEFLADYWAFYTLQEMGAPAGVVSQTLERIERAVGTIPEGGSGLQVGRLIGPRWRCMTLLEADAGITAGMMSLRSGTVGSIVGSEGAAQPSGSAGENWSQFVSMAQGKEATKDDLYWACAMWSFAAVSRKDVQLTELFSRRARGDFPAAFKRFAAGPHPHQLGGQSMFATVMDGIPLMEAGLAYPRAKIDERPLLHLGEAEYRGWKDGRHAIKLRISNGGLTPTPAYPRIEAIHDSVPISATLCADAEYGDPPTLCRAVGQRGPLGVHASEYVNVLVEGPRDADFVKLPVTIVANACPPEGADCGDGAGRLAARLDIALDLRPHLVFYQMIAGGPPPAPGVQQPFVTLWLRNRGFSPTTRPVFLHAFKRDERVEISSCPPGRADGPCSPFVIPGPMAPEQEVKLPTWLVDPLQGRNGNGGFSFVVSDCAMLERRDQKANEGTNCSGELREGPGNYYGRR